MGYKIGIVVSEFSPDITMKMLEFAKERADSLGLEVNKIVKVPGSFDMPLAIKKLLELDSIDAVVTLGAVIEGDTDHDVVVAHNAARKMADLSVQYNKPVSLGVTGPKMTREAAVKRVDTYAKRAVEAVFKLLKEFEKLKKN